MALEYRLTLAGTTPVEQVAEQALPDPAERPTYTPPLFSADLFESHGFLLTIHAGKNGFYDVISDQGGWEWTPETYVNVGFRMDKFADSLWRVGNMLTVVQRVLSTGSEDAAFAFNGDVLYLTRIDGRLVKHHRETFWQHYPGADVAVPGPDGDHWTSR